MWLPLIFPVIGAILVEHVSLVTYRVVFEEREQRRVKFVFSKIVSPDVVAELLGAEKLSLGGARREVTVFFADVRGFTSFTDQLQEDVAEYVRTHNVDLATAEKFYEESAHETLEIVNLYLAAVADAVKNHSGTLDKYIGDCVMAFWNAPTPNARHALADEGEDALPQFGDGRLGIVQVGHGPKLGGPGPKCKSYGRFELCRTCGPRFCTGLAFSMPRRGSDFFSSRSFLSWG